MLCSSDVSCRSLYTLTCVRGCPAYAGMDLTVDRRHSHISIFSAAPPTRGWTAENRQADQLQRQTRAAPPTRGWTHIAQYRQTWLHGYGLPRLRGDGPWPSSLKAAAPPHRLPRLRGDGPFFSNRATPFLMAAPPTRGWTVYRRRAIVLPKGCPATRGWTQIASPSLTISLDGLPRLRGDGPEQPARLLTAPHCRLPRLRGDGPDPSCRASSAKCKVGCPAYAGMDPIPYESSKTLYTSAAPPTRGWTLRTRY